MMLLLLDRDFNVCGTIEQYECLIWKRKYFEPGSFSLVLPASFFRRMREAVYLFHPRNNETAVIETIEFTSGSDGERSLAVSGRMLECLLGRRVIQDTAYLSGSVGDAVNDLVRTYAMTGDRKIPLLSYIGENTLTEPIDTQVAGADLLDTLYTLLKPCGASLSLKYSADRERLEFSAWKGINRAQTQTENRWAVFSTSLENVAASAYSCRRSDYRNFAYVYGTEQNGERIFTTVNRIKSGEERRELFVDARDLKKTVLNNAGEESTLTDEEYKQLLAGRGAEKLEQYAPVEAFTGTLSQNAPPVYRVDYDLGDTVSLEDTENGISAELRVTELIEIWKDGRRKINAVFGEKAPVSVREMVRRSMV